MNSPSQFASDPGADVSINPSKKSPMASTRSFIDRVPQGMRLTWARQRGQVYVGQNR